MAGDWKENIGQITSSQDGEFFWMIPDIFVYSYEFSVTSPRFFFDQEVWYLVMLPTDGNSSIYSNNDWIGLFLWTKGRDALKKQYDVKLAIKTVDGRTVSIHKGETVTDYGFGRYNFLNIREEGSNIISNGLIKIHCVIKTKEDKPKDLSVCPTAKDGENENKTVSLKESNEKLKIEPELRGTDRLVQNFKDMLQNEWGSDVVLKNDDQEFRAHMIILGARSPVFASMFQHDMVEKKTGTVDISDCSTAGFKVFLQFLYTGDADDTMSTANVFDLYYIADKYQVDDLKADCVDYMEYTLSVDTFCDVAALSLRHCESDLQNAATRFFCENIKGIVKTVQWQKYITEYPVHANEFIIKAVNA